MQETNLSASKPNPTRNQPLPEEEWRQALTRATRRSALDREREIHLHLEKNRNPHRSDDKHSR
jgi:hypothetical protein